MNSTEMIMSDWLNLAKLDVPYDLLFSSSMGCGGYGNKKEDDTMVRKYRKQVDGIEVNEENIPLISEKLVKIGVYAFEWNVDLGKLYVSGHGDWDFRCDFGQYIRITEDGVSRGVSKEYEIYILGNYDGRMKGFDKLYDAKNVRNIHLFNNGKGHSGCISIDLENGDSFGEELMDTILVFDSEGEFVELVSSFSLSPDTVMAKHGYVRVYDESVE